MKHEEREKRISGNDSGERFMNKGFLRIEPTDLVLENGTEEIQ
jgi:hypothetical protein